MYLRQPCCCYFKHNACVATLSFLLLSLLLLLVSRLLWRRWQSCVFHSSSIRGEMMTVTHLQRQPAAVGSPCSSPSRPAGSPPRWLWHLATAAKKKRENPRKNTFRVFFSMYLANFNKSKELNRAGKWEILKKC